ncbi:MAG TPA: VWA domain-containing protein [Chloroflexia bacterium]|nr:VWA domain-containing protein [Chloroflexia bacterium]
MDILEPLALITLPLLGAVIALYLLRFRRPTAPVASLRLWDILTRDREANTLWQRLQVSVLLLLQLLVLLVLILALARPWVPSERVSARNIVLVIDVSASMGASDADDGGSKTRLELAQEKARQIVDNMPQESAATLIAADTHASIVVPATDDKARLRSAITNLRPNAANTDLSEALRVASTTTAGKGSSLVWVMSDGAFPPLAQLDAGTAEYRFFAVGNSQPNQGITAMSLRQDELGLGLFVQVANSADITVTRRIDVSVDEAPWNARTIDVGPGATQEVIIPDVPLGARVLEASLAGHDVLTFDDRAWTVNRASVPANVLLVTSGSRFLEAALSLLPTVTLYKIAPEDYTPSAGINGGPFDLTVFDSIVPTSTLSTLPGGNLLFVGLPTSNQLFNVSGAITNPIPLVSQSFDPSLPSQESAYNPREPLMRFVDAASLKVARASLVAVPPWGRQVLGSDKGPLIIAGESAGRKVAALTFDLKDSDLPLQTAFPLLMRNLVSYLIPDPAAGLPSSIAPLTTIALESVSPVVDRVLVEDPDGREHTYALTPEQPRVAFADTGLTGVYYVTQYSGDTIAAQEAFTVNLFSRDESSTPTNASPQLPQGVATQAGATVEQATRQEFWPLVALAGIALLLLEWLYAQRIAVRRAITEMRTRRALRNAENERT